MNIKSDRDEVREYLEAKNKEPCIVAVGTLASGLTFIGPFKNAVTAMVYGENLPPHSRNEWFHYPLTPPVEQPKEDS
tara:strand:- start:4360 stop:4590 length:231 start_codon:yes stop_codon:yes gene_type:complete